MKLHYFKSNNFGDALSPALVARMSGNAVEYSDPLRADMAAAGSVLYSGHWLFRDANYNHTFRGAFSWLRIKSKTKRTPVKVWGSGFLAFPPSPGRVAVLRKLDVYALRGRVSHRILCKLGLLSPSRRIAYGDPGLLYPELLDRFPAKEYEVGIVPHYFDVDAGRKLSERFLKNGLKTLLIDVLNCNPLQTLTQIACCETVLSSSLHGCIVADAMGIPNRQVSFSTLGMDKENYSLKFKDYYSAYGMDWPAPLEKCELELGLCGIPGKITGEYKVGRGAVEDVKHALMRSFKV